MSQQRFGDFLADAIVEKDLAHRVSAALEQEIVKTLREVRIHEHVSLVPGLARTQRELKAKPVAGHRVPARAESAHGGRAAK